MSRFLSYSKHSLSCFIRYKTLGCASRFISDKTLSPTRVLNSTYCLYLPSMVERSGKNSSLCHQCCRRETRDEVCVLTDRLIFSVVLWAFESWTPYRKRLATSWAHCVWKSYVSINIFFIKGQTSKKLKNRVN
jgi:hypothetical protein